MKFVVYYDEGFKRYSYCSMNRIEKFGYYSDETPILITPSERIARGFLYAMREQEEG